MRLQSGLDRKRIYDTFRAHGKCLVAADVVFHPLGNSAAQIP